MAVPTPDALAGPERAADAIAELIEKIADVPHPSRLAPYVMVLAEAVRQQGRDADAVWSEFGLPRPD